MLAALRIDPEDAGSRRNLGDLYRKQGRYGLAEEQLLSAVGLDSLDRESWKGLWNTPTSSRSRPTGPSPPWRTAIRLDSTYAEAHRDLGELLELIGRSEEAETHRDRFEHLDRLEERSQTLRTGIAERPDHLEARLALGEILERMGRSQEALDAYAAVVERDPEKGRTPWKGWRSFTLTRGTLRKRRGWRAGVIALGPEPEAAARAYSVLGLAMAQAGDLGTGSRRPLLDGPRT